MNAKITWIPTLDALTMVYTGFGNILIDIGYFAPHPPGVVLLEQTLGVEWFPFQAAKLGRGMSTNCVDSGPAQFRGQLQPSSYTAFRVRCQDTLDMRPIDVRITYAGASRDHILRAESKYVIEEVPDIRDLAHY